MRIKHRIAFSATEHSKLTSWLSAQGIAWKHGEIVSTVEMYEDSPYWQFVHRYACENKMLVLSSTVFSQSELDHAQWLRIRSQWHYGYPQPEEDFGYRSVTYQEGCRCEACGAGSEQAAPFRMKKSPAWGKRHFMMLNWVQDELFVSDICKSLLEKENLSGIRFGTVSNKQGSGILPNVNQLLIPARLAPGIIADRRSIDKVFLCDSCGATKYHPTGIGMTAYDKEIFRDAPDFVRTAEIFGWGVGASHQIIISQKAYRALVRNKLTQGLVFEPIELV